MYSNSLVIVIISARQNGYKIIPNQELIAIGELSYHGVQLMMISVDNFFVFLRLLYFALLLLHVT